MSANSSPLFHCHSGKILLCQFLNISQLFEPDRNIKRALGMKPRSPPEKRTDLFKIKKPLFEQ